MFVFSILYLGDRIYVAYSYFLSCFHIFDLADNTNGLSYHFKEATVYFSTVSSAAERFPAMQSKLQHCLFHRSPHVCSSADGLCIFLCITLEWNNKFNAHLSLFSTLDTRELVLFFFTEYFLYHALSTILLTLLV